jgi:S1-C subfamily serine protease
VLEAGGVLLTSEALVRGVETAKVLLADGRVLEGEVAARDARTGLAVVKVPTGDLQPLTRSEHDPKPGDLAVTVAGRSGPQAEPTVSSGVVSSLDRSVSGEGASLWGLVETDSPVPAAADGGALVGPDGHVSGISLHLPVDGGVGYAVPIETAWNVGMDLLRHGRARPAWLGVTATTLEADEAEDLGIAGGVRLAVVAEDGPGAVAGLEVGDVIVRIDGSSVRSMDDLQGSMNAHRPDQTAAIVVLRDGDELTFPVELGEKEAS